MSSSTETRIRPICFVAMPFGEKPGTSGTTIHFDRVYAELIAPAIHEAGLEPLRADEELGGGIIHKPMFEGLLLSDYAVADLTTANANVYYELGVRHAVRPFSTVLIYSEGARLPFDVRPLRAVPYRLDDRGVPANATTDIGKLVAILTQARKATADHPDSPVFQLLDDLRPPEIAHTRTDVFRDRVQYSNAIKRRLSEARQGGEAAVRGVQNELGPIEDTEAGVVIDLFLSYRATSAWESMIELVEKMSPPLAETVMVQEQLGLALNRAGYRDRAEQVLRDLLRLRGPGSETYGILGRVYKDRWEDARTSGEEALAQGYLDKAIDAYLSGFESDWRDAYPGINAVTLMEIRSPPDPRRVELLPVVRYSVQRRLTGEPDYWDHATVLELAVLAGDETAATQALASSLASVREPWEPETTARNLRLIRDARESRGEASGWIRGLEAELLRRASG